MRVWPESCPNFSSRLRNLKQQSRAKLSPGAYDYVAGGAGAEETMRANSEAFRKWRIVPRMLRDVARATCARTVLEPKCRRQSCWHPSASSPSSTLKRSCRSRVRRRGWASR